MVEQSPWFRLPPVLDDPGNVGLHLDVHAQLTWNWPWYLQGLVQLPYWVTMATRAQTLSHSQGQLTLVPLAYPSSWPNPVRRFGPVNCRLVPASLMQDTPMDTPIPIWTTGEAMRSSMGEAISVAQTVQPCSSRRHKAALTLSGECGECGER